jgi:rubrerythrin
MDNAKLEELFSMAINREMEAHEFYNGVAGRISDAETKKVFSQLAEEELDHQRLLEKMKDNPEMMMKFSGHKNDYKVAEATDMPELSLEMKPVDAIALAMKKELLASKFYKRLAEETDDAETKQHFERLSNMEINHKTRLESIFVQIGYPESF